MLSFSVRRGLWVTAWKKCTRQYQMLNNTTNLFLIVENQLSHSGKDELIEKKSNPYYYPQMMMCVVIKEILSRKLTQNREGLFYQTKLSVYSVQRLLRAATTANLTVSSSLNIWSCTTLVNISKPPNLMMCRLVGPWRHNLASPTNKKNERIFL